jgi:hypothetical protein
MEPRLQRELAALEQTLRQTQALQALTRACLAAAALAALFLLIRIFTGWTSHFQVLLPALIGGFALIAARQRVATQSMDSVALISALEREHPELRHLLSAAAEQKPDPESGEFRYLQLRVINEVLQHPRRILWKQNLKAEMVTAGKKCVAAVGTLLILVLILQHGPLHTHLAATSPPSEGITVTPGDTEVERGTSLVISARFGHDVPAEATLVLVSASGKTRYIPLERHLADPVFGGSLSEVSEAGIYHIEYAGGKTRDYKISVFEYPALVRADAHLQYPEYTHLTNRTIPDTLRVSAIEGSHLTYELRLNKSVTHARLVGHEQTLELQVTNNSIAMLNEFLLTNTAHYSLALEDAQGRTNKFPSDFVLVALTNQRPNLKLVLPHGDQRVSKLEEIQLQGEATGEFGLGKYGVGYTMPGKEPHLIELGQTAPSGQRQSFKYLLPLEKLGVEEDQVVAYFVWADDVGPDGNARRTFSDIFFAEVRPFEEIFRPDQSGSAGNESGQGGQQGNRGNQLAQMQKEIIIATWKLQQEKSPGGGIPAGRPPPAK